MGEGQSREKRFFSFVNAVFNLSVAGMSALPLPNLPIAAV